MSIIIGSYITILGHSNYKLIDKSGIIIYETRKTLLIELKNGKRIRVFKNDGVYQIIYKSKICYVNGSKLRNMLELDKARCK
jgi:ribonuclease P protein subunit POP4